MKEIVLIPYKEVYQHINVSREMRRLSLYDIKKLKEVFYFERKKALKLYRQLDAIYDIRKLNFAHEFNLKVLYLEDCVFNEYEPKKEELISSTITFLIAQFFIQKYLEKLRINQN